MAEHADEFLLVRKGLKPGASVGWRNEALLASIRLEEQLEAVRTWFRTEPWKGHPDGSSHGCGDYTQTERAMGYGSYRDPRFLPEFLREVSSPASEPEAS